MKWLFLVLALVVPSTAVAADEWTPEERSLEAAYLMADVLDWSQTRYIAAHPEKFEENNPVLGPHPSQQRVDTWFTTAGIGQVVIAHYLPHQYREGWIMAGLFIETAMVTHNAQLNVRFKW